MEDIKQVLALFDSANKWNAFIELSNMKDAMVDELKYRLLIELKRIADKSLINSGWNSFSDTNKLCIKPNETSLIAISIEWSRWNAPNTPWCRRGACVWIDANSTNSNKVFEMIKSNKASLPLQDYEENIHNHIWFPFIKQIPSRVFNVNDDIVSVEECLYMAKDNATQLAMNIWEDVFRPFATRENADLMKSFVMQ